eukprot:7747347-Pyramimonas_sp.AAC.1
MQERPEPPRSPPRRGGHGTGTQGYGRWPRARGHRRGADLPVASAIPRGDPGSQLTAVIAGP